MTAILIIAIGLAGAAGIVGIVVWVVRRAAKSNKGKQAQINDMKRLIAAHGTPVIDPGGKARDDAVDIVRGPRRYQAFITVTGKTPPALQIHGDLEATVVLGGTPFRQQGGDILDRLPRMKLRPERGADRFGKKLRLNREVQTGDAPFDNAVYIESTADDDEVLAMLASPRVRRAVLQLFSLGVREVCFNEWRQHLVLRWSGRYDDNPFASDPVTPALAELDAIVAELPRFASVELDKSATPGSGFVLTSVLAFIVSLIALIVGNAYYKPLAGEPILAVLSISFIVVLMWVIGCNRARARYVQCAAHVRFHVRRFPIRRSHDGVERHDPDQRDP